MADQLVEILSAATIEPLRHGGKALGLGRLLKLGHPVPPGFVVTVAAFLGTLHHLGLVESVAVLGASIKSGEPNLELAADIREILVDGSLMPGLEDAVSAASAYLWSGFEGSLIVRSSATVEDAKNHSFAGIFESVPLAMPESLSDAIRSVWGSVFTTRAVSYAAMSGLAEVPAMALVVQQLVAAERSGVMFTTFSGPGGKGGGLVEHVAGTAESLVRGEVTPDRIWLGIPGEADSVSLAPEYTAELARLAPLLEEQLGGPQDVEWCVAGGQMYLVQTRPVTVMAAPATSEVIDAPVLLRGLGASLGTDSGQAHLVFNIEDALDTQVGDVLVAPMTNPDMVIAMRTSSAIVTDVGGMICHAAIVSRELALPCVVGTRDASSVLAEGQVITVDGTHGLVLDGSVNIAGSEVEPARPADIWSAWTSRAPESIPLVYSSEMMRDLPDEVAQLALVVDFDLRFDAMGLWRDIERELGGLRSALSGYLAGLEVRGNLKQIYLTTLGAVPANLLADLVEELDDEAIRSLDDWETEVESVVGQFAPGVTGRSSLPSVSHVIQRMSDPSRVFGHEPEVVSGPMPNPAHREAWWHLLPEYGRFHREHGSNTQCGDFEWVNVRPEIVISPLLKSFVQPGFEMVPRVLGFGGLPPMHTKWIRGRFHFRADTFAATWGRIVQATFDSSFMADLMARVRQSYDQLAEVLSLFPENERSLIALSSEQIKALITSWWPRWIEFFALSQFLQAQGDDIAYPFIDALVSANLDDLEHSDVAWPTAAEFVLPTAPVLSAGFVESVGRVRSALDAAGLSSTDEVMSAFEEGEHSELQNVIESHLREWYWMRDRDLVFEPWDTPRHVVEAALRTGGHAPVAYGENRRRNRFATSIHAGLLADQSQRGTFVHAARFLQDLSMERENHHVLWLRYSYALRQLVVEVERRLVRGGSLQPGEVFFLQAPELLTALADLTVPLPRDLKDKVRNRRRGYLLETRLDEIDSVTVAAEDDYY